MSSLNEVDIQVTVPLPCGDRVVLIKRESLNPGPFRQRNIFRISDYGEVVWQIGDYQPIPGLSTFTNLYFDESGTLMGYNFDGREYEIDLQTGACKPSRLLK